MKKISLMNAGKVLAADTPKGLRESRKAKTAEEAFIGYLDAARAPDQSQGGETASRFFLVKGEAIRGRRDEVEKI